MRLLTLALSAAVAYAALAAAELSDLRADVAVMTHARNRLLRDLRTLSHRVARLEESARIERELERSRDRLMNAIGRDKRTYSRDELLAELKGEG